MSEEAFTAHFTDHHAFRPQRMPARVDAINVDIAALEAKIEEQTAPFGAAAAKLDEISGVNPAIAHVILAEIGIDMHRSPPPGIDATPSETGVRLSITNDQRLERWRLEPHNGALHGSRGLTA